MPSRAPAPARLVDHVTWTGLAVGGSLVTSADPYTGKEGGLHTGEPLHQGNQVDLQLHKRGSFRGPDLLICVPTSNYALDIAPEVKCIKFVRVIVLP